MKLDSSGKSGDHLDITRPHLDDKRTSFDWLIIESGKASHISPCAGFVKSKSDTDVSMSLADVSTSHSTYRGPRKQNQCLKGVLKLYIYQKVLSFSSPQCVFICYQPYHVKI